MQFGKFITSFDVFGEPVSLNYNGESSFKTLIGAFFTVLIKLFLIDYVTGELIDLFGYKNPQITIVSLFCCIVIQLCLYYSIRNIRQEQRTIL